MYMHAQPHASLSPHITERHKSRGYSLEPWSLSWHLGDSSLESLRADKSKRVESFVLASITRISRVLSIRTRSFTKTPSRTKRSCSPSRKFLATCSADSNKSRVYAQATRSLCWRPGDSSSELLSAQTVCEPLTSRAKRIGQGYMTILLSILHLLSSSSRKFLSAYTADSNKPSVYALETRSLLWRPEDISLELLRAEIKPLVHFKFASKATSFKDTGISHFLLSILNLLQFRILLLHLKLVAGI